ncbi:MAG: Mu-like prophage major head subunit gpT family protein [Chitinophagaceae bacterium]|nr:Mu-like prophage major head subunit gpT family protein [Chitinophagaceae bacterium]
MSTIAKIKPSHIRADIDKNSFNEKDNTIEVVFATGTPVRRHDWYSGTNYNEVLEISEKAIDFSRLKNGASVLNAHNSYKLESVIGVVVDAWISNSEARAKVRLSEEPEDATIVNKVKKGIIRNISVGYDVLEYTIIDNADEQIPTWTATRWQPMELSFVPVPADPNANVRNQEQDFITAKIVNPINTMEEKQRNQPVTKTQPIAEHTPAKSEVVNVEEIRKSAIADERKRVSDITEACKRAGLPTEIGTKLIAEGKTVDQARAEIIDEVAKRANPAPVSANVQITGEDEADQIRSAIITGIVERANPGSEKDFSQNEKAKLFRNMRLLDLAKDRLRAKGEKFALLSEQEIVKRAFATTDFPDLLSSAFSRSLRRYYDAVVDDWSFIARQETATDFREKTGVKVDGAVTFEEIPEGGEYRESPILQNEKATIKLKKYGRKYSITDIAIINDDLSVFSRLPRIMAIGAQQFQSQAVWDNIISNKNAWDGTALFHTSHKNLATDSGDKKAPEEANLAKARAAMRKQKSPAGNTLNIVPRYLIVPPDLEVTALKLVTAVLANATGSVNVFANAFEVKVINQFTDTKAWYLAADPNEITADGIVYAYLNGQPGLRTESRVNFDTDSLEVKGSMAFATAIWGWQGWFKNPGQ